MPSFDMTPRTIAERRSDPPPARRLSRLDRLVMAQMAINDDAKDVEAEFLRRQEGQPMPNQITLAQARDMAEAHAEGMHADLPREGCPECEDRPLKSYPREKDIARAELKDRKGRVNTLPKDPGYYIECGQTDPA
jgi:hypothetical protein